MKDSFTICEELYKLRDAVLDHNLPLAILLSREVHDKLMALNVLKESIDCTLNCEIKDKNEDNISS